MTNLSSYHQGMDRSLNLKSKVAKEDWNWNYLFIKRSKDIRTDGALLSNYLICSENINAYDQFNTSKLHP